MKIQLESPADRLLAGRSEFISGWIDAPDGVVSVSATCGSRPIMLRCFRHPATYSGARIQGFWGHVIVQELLGEIREGFLSVRIYADGCEVGSVDLRVSPIAVAMAREYPLNLARYPVTVDARVAPAPIPGTLVFPGLGGVGGASLNDLLRRKMLDEGWETLVYHEADDPGTWSRIANSGRVAPRWIDGHACYAAGEQVAGRSVRVTLLREPCARLISIFNYNSLVHPTEFPYRSFDDFVRSGAARSYGQVFGLLRAAGVSVSASMSQRELYERTRMELTERYALVGIAEQFEETIFLLAGLAGYESIGMWWRVLAAPPSIRWHRLAASVRRALERQLDVETRLYEEQRAEFARRLRSAGVGASLVRYKSDASTGPSLPDTYKMAECLRWRQVMVESTLRRLQDTNSDRARGAA